MSDLVCTKCLYQGKTSKETPGSFLIELILWLCFLVPGIIYSIWRLSSKKKVCRSCGSSELIPVDSPMGRRLVGGAPPRAKAAGGLSESGHAFDPVE